MKPTRAVLVYQKDGKVWGTYLCRACNKEPVADQPLHLDCDKDYCARCSEDLQRVKALFA